MTSYKLARYERMKDARIVHNQHGKQTIQEVSEATGVSSSLIANIENSDSRSVGCEKIAALASHYDVSTDWLLGLTDDPRPKNSEVDGLGLSAKAIKQVAAIQQSPSGSDLIGTLNLILESPDLLFILTRINAVSDAMDAEVQYLRQSNLATILDQQLDSVTIEDELEKEIYEKYPKLKNRVSVFCGSSAIEYRLDEIGYDFSRLVKWALGYMDIINTHTT